MPTLGKNRLGGDVEGGDGQIAHSIGPPQRSAWRPAEIRRTEPGAGVRVGVLDTSLYAHPWLAGALVGPREDFLAERSEYPVEAGHGTFVAGLVLQRAPGCTIEFRKVLSEEEGTATSWDVAKRIVEVGRGGLDVLNLSLGCYTEDGQPPLLLSTAIDRLDPGIVVVAAAGNHGDVEEISDEEKRKPAWPAALDDVIAVGSTDADGFPSSFTPHDVPWIDVYARGEKVRSTYLETRAAHVDGVDPSVKLLRFDGWAEWSGTSFAAALVSGAIAAKTSPGRLSARAAWQELLDEAPVLRREVQAKLEEQGRHAEVRTRFLRVFETTDRPGDHSCGRGPVPPAGSAQQPDGKVGRRGSRILGRKRPGPS
jgi:hypothetical protein